MLFLQIYKKGVLFFVETMNYSGYVQRTWFAWRHRVMGLYYAGEHSADVYWHRALINQKDVGIALQLPDPTNEKISWFLILQKK